MTNKELVERIKSASSAYDNVKASPLYGSSISKGSAGPPDYELPSGWILIPLYGSSDAKGAPGLRRSDGALHWPFTAADEKEFGE